MADPLKTIFRKGTEPSDTQYWLIWHDEVEVNKTPVIEDTYDRLYWSGEALDYPKYKPWSEIQSEWAVSDGIGNTIYCDGPAWRLGVPPPGAAPILAGGEAGTVDTIDREYVVTWFSPNAGESCASDVLEVTANVGYDVILSDLPTNPPSGVTYLYVYRRNGSSGSFRYVGRATAGQSVFTDNVDDGDLGGELSPALLACSLGTYAAPTVAPDTPITEPGAAVTYYYTWVLYQRVVTTEPLGEGDGPVGPGITGWLPAAGSPVSASVDPTQEVTLTLPRDGNGRYYNEGRWQSSEDQTFGVSTSEEQAKYYWLILRSTSYTPANNDFNGFEVVGFVTPKLTSDLTAHTFTVPAKSDETSYLPSIQSFNILTEVHTTSYISRMQPLAASVGASSSGDISELQKRTYTLVYEDGSANLTGRSADSAVINVLDGDSVTLTLPTAPVSAVTTHIYRLGESTGGVFDTDPLESGASRYQLVASVAAATSNYVDTVLDSALGAFIPDDSLVVEYAGPDVTAASSVAEAEAPADQIPETRLYVYTYVTEYGEEGPPSPVSDLIEVYPGASVTISGLLGNPNATQYNITAKRIYRSSTGTNLTTLQFVASVPIEQGEYTDALPGSELGEVIPSTYYYPPPATCRGMRVMANGIMVMFDGKTLYPSELYLPHAYDPNNFKTTESEIVGLGVFGQSLAVLTTSYPYVLSGVDPSAMSLTRLPIPQSCCSERSIASTGDGVVYASPDGMMLISSQGVKNLTEMILNRDQWQAYNPYTMHTYVYNNYVFVFHDTGCIMFNFSGAAAIMSELDITAVSGFYDAIQDALFYAKDDGIYKWDAGDLVAYTWRSKIFQVTRPHNFAWAQVEADSYPLTCKVYNGLSSDPLHTETVASREPFRLPSGSVHRDWYVQLEGTATVFQVQLADSVEELKQV